LIMNNMMKSNSLNMHYNKKRSIVDGFIDYLFDKYLRIDNCVLKKSIDCLRDYSIVVKAGAKKNEKYWKDFLDIIPCGNIEVYGYNKKTDSKTAAFVNGFNAHALELDDGHRFAMLHLGASIISAINAAASESNITQENILKGIVMGYEAACRIAISIQPSHKNKGFHASGTCGTIGAGIGVAFALEMNKNQLKRVITAATSSAAGLLEIQEQMSEVKAFNLGRAAMDGLMAAYFGFASFLPPDDILDGDRGFLKIFADSFSADALLERNDLFEIQRVYFKSFASCRHSHSAVDAAITLHDRCDYNDIDNVVIFTYSLGVKGHDHTEIKNSASAKLSTPYAVAAALIFGRADLTMFEPLNETVVEFSKKIRIVERLDLTKLCPKKRSAVVRLYLKNGHIEECRVDYAKGEPENPLTQEDLLKKAELLEQYIKYGVN